MRSHQTTRASFSGHEKRVANVGAAEPHFRKIGCPVVIVRKTDLEANFFYQRPSWSNLNNMSPEARISNP